MLSKNKEDYLEIIFHLESEGKDATTKDIAAHLNITPASVSENLKKLSEDKLVVHLPYKSIKLTPKGRRSALDIIRRHRLSERFLVDKLGLKWEEVHEQAHQLEHGISKVVGDKLYKMLGKPKTCPHGNPMPDENGRIEEEHSVPLASLNGGDHLQIVKITDEEPKLLCYLATLGLMPRTKLTIERKAPFNGPIMVKVGSAIYALGKKIAESIWVKKYEHR